MLTWIYFHAEITILFVKFNLRHWVNFSSINVLRCLRRLGFGPFAMHQVNASWVAVQELQRIGLGDDLDVSLMTLEIPVEYSTVMERVPALWKQFNPQVCCA